MLHKQNNKQIFQIQLLVTSPAILNAIKSPKGHVHHHKKQQWCVHSHTHPVCGVLCVKVRAVMTSKLTLLTTWYIGYASLEWTMEWPQNGQLFWFETFLHFAIAVAKCYVSGIILRDLNNGVMAFLTWSLGVLPSLAVKSVIIVTGPLMLLLK